VILETKRLKLRVESIAEARSRVEAMSPSERAEVSADWLARLECMTSPDPWVLGFAIELRDSSEGIGSCGFKGPPDAGGVAEIAYGIQPEHQGNGYATEAARALVRYALESPKVRIVRAHTLPAASASTRVLSRCGFTCVGEVIDPEDGRVWRWEKRADTAEPAA
jgi:RimJ/RimL family protein N-acetyltransferase